MSIVLLKILLTYKICQLWQCIWKRRLQNVSHFVPAPFRPQWVNAKVKCRSAWGGGGGGGGSTRAENCWGCAVGHWKLDPKRSRGKWYFGAKKIEFSEDLYPKDRFCVGGWEKTPQKDRVWYPEDQKRGSKPRHICIAHHIGSTPPPPGSEAVIINFGLLYTRNRHLYVFILNMINCPGEMVSLSICVDLKVFFLLFSTPLRVFGTTPGCQCRQFRLWPWVAYIARFSDRVQRPNTNTITV